MLYFPSMFSTKLQSLVARMLSSPKTKPIAVVNAFSWKFNEWKSWGTITVVLAKDLTLSMLLMGPPFVDEYISRSRDLSFLLLLEIAVALLKEKGEKGLVANFCTHVKIPAHMLVNTPSAKNNLSHTCILKQLVELDVKAAMCLAVVERQEVFLLNFPTLLRSIADVFSIVTLIEGCRSLVLSFLIPLRSFFHLYSAL